MNPTTAQPDPALQLIIQRITENLLIDQIYLHPYRIQGKQVNQLYVLLRNSAGQGITSARALCNLAVAEKPQYRCHVATPEDLNRKIRQGNMRATLICQPDKLVFEHPDVDTCIQLPKVDFQVWHEQAEAYFEKEIARIHAFEEGYTFYMSNANCGQAAFMLHQVIEQGYRAAENLVMGKEKISHSLRNHQEYIAPFCPELGVLFEKQHEVSIMGKLDESYSSARYDHDFSMSKEDLAIAANKVNELIAYVIAYHRDLLNDIQQYKDKASEIISSEPTPEDEIQDSVEAGGIELYSDASSHCERILSVVNRYFMPTHVFCYAHRSREEYSVNLLALNNTKIQQHRYYLAILTEELPDQALHKQHQINEALGDELEIVALYFKLSTFNKKLEEGHGFFHFLAKEAERWCGEEKLLCAGDMPEPVDPEKQRWQWNRYFWNAEGLMEMVENQIGSRYDECCSVVMSQAMEQLCLGLLHVIWGYRPDSILNLMYLIQLTESITPLARKCFCLDIPEEREMVLELSKALGEFRYNSNFNTNGFDLYILRDRLVRFSNGVEELVNHHFETLDGG